METIITIVKIVLFIIVYAISCIMAKNQITWCHKNIWTTLNPTGIDLVMTFTPGLNTMLVIVGELDRIDTNKFYDIPRR